MWGVGQRTDRVERAGPPPGRPVRSIQKNNVQVLPCTGPTDRVTSTAGRRYTFSLKYSGSTVQDKSKRFGKFDVLYFVAIKRKKYFSFLINKILMEPPYRRLILLAIGYKPSARKISQDHGSRV
jgi:hypothetical protein